LLQSLSKPVVPLLTVGMSSMALNAMVLLYDGVDLPRCDGTVVGFFKIVDPAVQGDMHVETETGHRSAQICEAILTQLTQELNAAS